MTKIVGITGKKRAGKDTAAIALIQQGWTQIRFADPLKLMIRQLLRSSGIDSITDLDRLIEGDKKECPLAALCGLSTRYAMQTLGTEWGRKLMDDNLWINTALTRAREFPCVVISDVRFPNEAQAIKRIGGTIIKVIRSEQPREPADTHPSEVIDFPVDHILVNNSTIKALHQAVLEIVSKL